MKVNANEVIETAAFIVYERRGTIEGLYKDFQKFYDLMEYSEGMKINNWFISKLTVKGDQRRPHVFALLEALDKLDTTPADRSMFAGNPIKDFDLALSSLATKLPLLLSKESLDDPLLNGLFVLCKKQVAAAEVNLGQKGIEEKWRQCFLRLHSLLLKFTCIIQEHAVNRGITISSKPIVLSPSSEKLYLNCPYPERESAKALGARWDGNAKLWYTFCSEPLIPFQRWL